MARSDIQHWIKGAAWGTPLAAVCVFVGWLGEASFVPAPLGLLGGVGAGLGVVIGFGQLRASMKEKFSLLTIFRAIRRSEAKNAAGFNDTRKDISALDEKVDHVLAAIREQGDAPADSASEEGLRDTIKNLLTAGSGARKQAAEKLTARPPDPDAALSILKQHAAHGEEGTADLAETYRQIGAIAYYAHTQDAIDAYERVTRLAPGDVDGWNRLGQLHARVGAPKKAESSFEKVLQLADEQFHKQARGAALGNLGIINEKSGKLDVAEGYLKRSLTLNQDLGDDEGVAAILGNLGNVEFARGDLDAAEDCYRRGLAIDEKLGGKEGIAAKLGNLGNVEHARKNLDAAEDYFKRSLAIEEELGRKEGMAAILGNLGVIEQMRGNLDAAEGYHRRSLAIEEGLRHKDGVADQLINLGLLERTRGDHDAACAYWERSHALFLEIGAAPMVEQVAALMRDAGCPDTE